MTFIDAYSRLHICLIIILPALIGGLIFGGGGVIFGIVLGIMLWGFIALKQGCPKTPPPIRPPEIKPTPSQIWSPDPYTITIGLCLIASMYLLPIFSTGFIVQKMVSLSEAVQYCSSSLYSCTPSMTWGFYIGWIFSIGLIVFGLFSRK